MKEITHSQVGPACFCICFVYIFFKNLKKKVLSVVSLPAVALNQFSDMTFGEFKKSFLWSEPQVMACIQEVLYIVAWYIFFSIDVVFIFINCSLQNCSATKGNYFSSNAPHPDSIDWRKKGNFVTPVKNQVKFNDTKVYTYKHVIIIIIFWLHLYFSYSDMTWQVYYYGLIKMNEYLHCFFAFNLTKCLIVFCIKGKLW